MGGLRGNDTSTMSAILRVVGNTLMSKIIGENQAVRKLAAFCGVGGLIKTCPVRL